VIAGFLHLLTNPAAWRLLAATELFTVGVALTVIAYTAWSHT
jgi:hypothetical protein